MQFLATDNVIRVGSTLEDSVEVSPEPQTWPVRTGINEFALVDAKDHREEVAQRDHDNEEEAEDDDEG